MTLDLGQPNDYPTPALARSDGDKKISYPSLYFTCDKEYDMPDEGTATIKFRKIEDSENTRDPADPKYRYELEVQSIDVDGMEVDTEGDDAKPDFKGAIKKVMEKKMEE